MRGRNYTKIPLYVQVSPRILSVGQENVLLSHISKEFEQATWQVRPSFSSSIATSTPLAANHFYSSWNTITKTSSG